MRSVAANKYWLLDCSQDICHEHVAFKPAGQKGQGSVFCFPSANLLLLNLTQYVKVGSLHCSFILSHFLQKH